MYEVAIKSRQRHPHVSDSIVINTAPILFPQRLGERQGRRTLTYMLTQLQTLLTLSQQLGDILVHNLKNHAPLAYVPYHNL
jgi:hypothetical protein